MNMDECIAVLRKARARLEARGVAHLAVFGSVVHGGAGPESDIDVLIDFAPGARPTLVDLAALRHEISGLVGREADVALRDGLKPRLKTRILSEAVPVF